MRFLGTGSVATVTPDKAGGGGRPAFAVAAGQLSS